MPIKCSDLTCDEAKVDFGEWRRHIPDEYSTQEYKEAKAQMPYSLGGSDAGTVMGCNRYCTPYQLFDRLRNNRFEEVSEETRKLFEMGHRNEEHVATLLYDDLKEEYGEENVKCMVDKHTYLCSDRNDDGTFKYPWLVVNFDCYFKIRSQDGTWKTVLGEIKTVSSRNFAAQRGWKAGLIPSAYEWQCRLMMKALDIEECVICAAWGLSADDRVHFTIKRDAAKEERLLATCEQFISCIVDDVTPPDVSAGADDADAGMPAKIDIEWAETMRELWEANTAVEKAKAEVVAAEQRYQEVLAKCLPITKGEGNNVFEFENGDTLYLDVRNKRKRGAIDSGLLSMEHPDVYNGCCESKFSSTLLKKWDKANKTSYAKEYLRPGEETGEQTITVACYELLDEYGHPVAV